MRLKSIVGMLILFIVAGPALAYTIVRKDGSRITAQGPPEYKGGKAIFALPSGSKGSIPESAVDKAATEKANSAAPATTKATTASVVTNESLGKVAPGGKSKSAFTNEDLGKSEGGSTVEGQVTTGDNPKGESEADWAERHDEEMKRLEDERKGVKPGDKEKAAGKGASEPGASEKGAETPEDKVAKAQKKVDDLQAKLSDLDKKIGGGAGDATTVNEKLKTADELSKAQQELEDAKAGR